MNQSYPVGTTSQHSTASLSGQQQDKIDYAFEVTATVTFVSKIDGQKPDPEHLETALRLVRRRLPWNELNHHQALDRSMRRSSSRDYEKKVWMWSFQVNPFKCKMNETKTHAYRAYILRLVTELIGMSLSNVCEVKAFVQTNANISFVSAPKP